MIVLVQQTANLASLPVSTKQKSTVISSIITIKTVFERREERREGRKVKDERVSGLNERLIVIKTTSDTLSYKV